MVVAIEAEVSFPATLPWGWQMTDATNVVEFGHAQVLHSLYASVGERILQENCACTLPTVLSSWGSETSNFISNDCRSKNTIVISPTAKITAPQKIRIKGTGNVLVIGNNVTLKNASISFDGNGGCILIGDDSVLTDANVGLRHDGGVIAIGRGLSSSGGNIFCASQGTCVLIGDSCLFESQVNIRTSDGHGIFDRATKEKLNKPARVVVHEQVWIGRAVRLGKGVTIGAGSVIGEGSIVSGFIEPNCLYDGIPARKRHENIAWSRSTTSEGNLGEA